MGKQGDRVGKEERRGRVRAVSEIVPGIGRAAFRRFGFVQSAIVARWPEIVGETYAKHSAPDAINFPPGRRNGGTLRLVVAGPFAPTIKHVEPQIIERVNRFFGYAAVERLALVHGDVPVRAAPKPAAANDAPLPSDVRSTLKDITDPGLRASLEALARQIGVTEGPPTF